MKNFFFYTLLLFAFAPMEKVQAQTFGFTDLMFGDLAACPQDVCVRQYLMGQPVENGSPGTVTFTSVEWRIAGQSNVINWGICIPYSMDPSIAGQVLEVTLNYTTGSQILSYVGCLAIEGNLRTPTNLPIGMANVIVGDACTITTGAPGTYSCPDVFPGEDYTIVPEKLINPWNGVSTFDAVIIRRHLLFIQLFTSPYQYIAADVNNSGSVTTADIIPLQKVVLGIEPTFPNGQKSWRFSRADMIPNIPTQTNPQVFHETIPIYDLPSTLSNQDFIGIKIGDVNFSANPLNLVQQNDPPTAYSARSLFQLKVKDQSLKAGQEIEIPVSASGLTNKVAYQFSLDIDQDYLEVLDWEEGSLTKFDKNNFHLQGNELRAIWFDAEANPRSNQNENDLFVLRIKAKKNIPSLNGLIKLNEGNFEQAAFDEEGNVSVIDFKIESQKTALDVVAFPNPTTEGLNIIYPKNTTQGQIELVDLNGKVLSVYSTLPSYINLKNFATGIYYLRFTNGTDSSIQKIIKQ